MTAREAMLFVYLLIYVLAVFFFYLDTLTTKTRKMKGNCLGLPVTTYGPGYE